MKKIRNTAYLKYAGKTVPSNTVEATLREISDFCPCVSQVIRAVPADNTEPTYTYSLKTECKTEKSPQMR